MSNEHNEKIGTIKIADDVIAVCAVNATLQTKGVTAFSPVFSDNFSKNFFGKDHTYKGIKVSQNDDGISIDIYVTVEYGVKIPVVAWDIQETVKQQVEEMTDSPVKAVNIHVQGVSMKEQKETSDEQI
jgi:uncharacterized alkaline shock family protein YloU